jgi:hypothetical protein
VDHNALLFRERMRAVDWRFDRPDIRIPAVDAIGSGDTLRVSARTGAGHYAINGIERGFTVGHGWTLLAYRAALPYKAFASAAWVAALFVPAGLWCRTRKDGVLVALGLLSALMLVPALTPLVLTPAVQWVAAGVGLGIGAGLRRVPPSLIHMLFGANSIEPSAVT